VEIKGMPRILRGIPFTVYAYSKGINVAHSLARKTMIRKTAANCIQIFRLVSG